MIKLSRLNPARSLFFRVFLWFWLATLLIFFSALWLAKQLDSEARYMPLNKQQQKELSIVTRRLQKYMNRHDQGGNLDVLLAEANKRNRFGLVLLNVDTREVSHNLTRRRKLDVSIFDNFDSQSTPILKEVAGIELWGPGRITVKQAEHFLFLVSPRPGGSLRVVRHEYPELFGLFLLFVSASLCYLFVRGLLTPIAQLQNASKQLASGHLQARVGSASQRLDELGQLSRDFNNMSEQIETLLNGQKRLLADISHELRSPLARLQLSIGIALQQNDTDLSATTATALDRIEKEALQIEGMIGQVLLLSRLDNQHSISNLQEVNLASFMSPIVTDAKFEAEQNQKVLHYNAQTDISFQAEPELLSSAIENILRNAIHYSAGMIEVNVSSIGKQLIWEIADDGNGIEDSQLSKVFEPFYRESTARDRNSGGVGLGLAIALRAIHKHGGTIKAKNREKSGVKNSQKAGLVVTISMPVFGN